VERLFGTTTPQDIQFQFSDIDSVELQLQLHCPPIQLACGAGAISDARKRMNFAEASLNVKVKGELFTASSGLLFNKAAVVPDGSLQANSALFIFEN